MKAVEDCVEFIVGAKDPRAQFAGAVPFLKLMGIVAGGWQMARAALVAEKRLASREGRLLFMKPSWPPRASTPTTSWSRHLGCATPWSTAPPV